MADARSPTAAERKRREEIAAVVQSLLPVHTQAGAGVTNQYHDYPDDIVGVRVSDLRDFRAARSEEFGQFAVAQFFAGGAFWLGIDRLASASSVLHDFVFWLCVVVLITSLIIGVVGFRQMRRRQTRIDEIIRSAGLEP